MLNGNGKTLLLLIQCTNSPCLHPSAISQSVEVSAMIISTITITPHINAMTLRGLVMVTVSIVVVGAIFEGDGLLFIL